MLRQCLTWGGSRKGSSRKGRQEDAKNAKCFLIKQTWRSLRELGLILGLDVAAAGGEEEEGEADA
jgi:hypothetical protein